MDRGDRVLAVLGRPGQFEPAIGLESGPDLLRPFRDLIRRHADAHVRLGIDVVREVGGAVDDLHGDLVDVLGAAAQPPATPSEAIAAATSRGR